MAETGRYIYAITRPLEQTSVAGVGLGGGRLELVEFRDLVAVVSDVPLDQYDEDALKENLESLAWVEKVARAHDGVVQAVAAVGPVAPLRLATICMDDEAVRRRLEEWYDEMVRTLDRVDGRVEWSVKAFAPVGEAPPADPAPAASGAAYLKQKKAESESRRSHQADAATTADGIHRELASISVASRVLAPQDPRLTGHPATMVLNGAYLVDVDQNDSFESRVRELAKAHPDMGIEGGGPWAPYSFAVLETR